MSAEKQGKFGINRTGKNISPLLSKAMVDETETLTLLKCPPGNSDAIAQNRIEVMREGDGLGSISIPATFKGLAETALQMLKSNRPGVLIDKLGERLAFERTGVRIYEALISKFQIDENSVSNVASLERLQEIRNEEYQHFLLLSEVIETLGADPTAITPSADIAAMASMGIVQVLGDPRINFVQSLDAILITELSDNDCWKHLVELARQAGLDQVAEKFERAYKDEQEHLATIREWVTQFGLGNESQIEDQVA